MIDLIALKAVVMYLPSILIGAYLGVSIFKRLANDTFGRAIYVFVLISGVALIISEAVTCPRRAAV
jgi:uncharacterized membrane protein YfcA